MSLGQTARLLFFALIALGFSFSSSPASARESLEAFDMKAEPGQRDWKNFLSAEEKTRVKLWGYHKKRGKVLKDWSWGWRLGWVRACTFSRQPYCRSILKQALFDRALVVRAEAARRIGMRYENTGNKAVVKLLTKAYRDKRNLRHKKPLFVQNRILYALRLVGGKKAMRTAAKLSRSHKESYSYWQRLSAVEKVPGPARRL